ncbi:MAG: hypothetical protein ACLQGU_12475 [bacterium]
MNSQIVKEFGSEFREELPYSLELEKLASTDSGVSNQENINFAIVRKLNREVSKKIPQSEKKKLMREHLDLVKKRARTGLERSENLRLQLIRWKLDRIEDAEHGEEIDKLEAIIRAKEALAKDLEKIVSQFESPKKRTHPSHQRRSRS